MDSFRQVIRVAAPYAFVAGEGDPLKNAISDFWKRYPQPKFWPGRYLLSEDPDLESERLRNFCYELYRDLAYVMSGRKTEYRPYKSIATQEDLPELWYTVKLCEWLLEWPENLRELDSG